MVDYRDHQLLEGQPQIETHYQFTTRKPMDDSMPSLFIAARLIMIENLFFRASSPNAAAITLYDHLDANKPDIDSYIDLYNRYEDEIAESGGNFEHVGKMIVECLLAGRDDIRLFESMLPVTI